MYAPQEQKKKGIPPPYHLDTDMKIAANGKGQPYSLKPGFCRAVMQKRHKGLSEVKLQPHRGWDGNWRYVREIEQAYTVWMRQGTK